MEDPREPPALLRVCPSCNSRIDPDHTFCEICGGKMPELPACSNCGALFIAPVKFCERCGTRVIPGGDPGPSADKRPGHDSLPDAPAPVQSRVKKDPRVPLSQGKDLPGGVDDALFLISEEQPPVKPKAGIAPLIGGVVCLFIILAAVYFIGLPMLSKSGGADVPDSPVTTQVTPGPESGVILSIQTTTPAPVPGPLDPRPTQAIPADQTFNFLVQKNRVDARISVIFTGSAGINGISSADVKVSRPDGTFSTGSILPLKGMNEVTLDGSKEADRVEIIARMPDGSTYRVYDARVPFGA